MLARTLEPEVMDSFRDAIDYDAMDHSEVNRRFVDDLLAAADVPGEVLDLGAGTAQIPIELCRRNSGVKVLAVDLAPSMLDLARANIEIAGLTMQVMVDRVDAKQLPYADGRFACVMSNSIVHHIAEPRCVLAEALRVLAPGGLFFFRDLERPANEETLARLVEAYADGSNEHQKQLFADSLRAALTLQEMQTLAAELGATPDAVRRTSDRHWTWQMMKPQG